MSEEHMNIDQRMKTWDGFLKLMTYSGAAATVTLLLMWWALV